MRLRQMITATLAVGLAILLVRVGAANQGSLWVAGSLYAVGLLLLVLPGIRKRIKASRKRSGMPG